MVEGESVTSRKTTGDDSGGSREDDPHLRLHSGIIS